MKKFLSRFLRAFDLRIATERKRGQHKVLEPRIGVSSVRSERFLLAALFLLVYLIFGKLALAQEVSSCVYYFYGDGCLHCANVASVLGDIEEKYPDLKVERFEIWYDRENAELFQEISTAFGVPEPWGVPTVFIGEKYFAGDSPIIAGLEDEILANSTAPCPLSDGNSSPGLGALSLATVIGAALVDSINPCAIAVLLILLSALLLTGERKRALRAGLAFISSIYIAYFLFGLGLFSAIQVSGISDLVYRFVGILAIGIGLLNIKDYFWYGAGGFVMEIPRRWRHTLKDLLYKATSPWAAFLIGFLVVLFELPCTGGPYFFVLGLLAKKLTLAAAVPYLLLYNLFFIAPLLILAFLIYGGLSTVEKAAQWKERNVRILHLIAGIVLVILGVVVSLRLV